MAETYLFIRDDNTVYVRNKFIIGKYSLHFPTDTADEWCNRNLSTIPYYYNSQPKYIVFYFHNRKLMVEHKIRKIAAQSLLKPSTVNGQCKLEASYKSAQTQIIRMIKYGRIFQGYFIPLNQNLVTSTIF